MTIEQRWQKFWELWRSGGWEPDTKALLARTLEPGDLFLDIGAWIGPVTLWALECGANVIAIEPDPVALPELSRQVAPYADRVEIWAGALALERGCLQLAPKTGYGDSMSRVAESGVEVQCWTLPEILGDRRPKLAVMDIEGYEMTLLPEVAPYLASLGCALQVALHTDVPPREWFAGYRDVYLPKTARRGGGPSGRSLAAVAYL